MSLRARMHPRNIYKIPPNFKELAIEYPEFRKYVKQELSGKVTLDYNDRKAVMELTKLLLLKDFNLMVEVNEARLIPRVPLCLNYLLWVEDLIETLAKTDEVRGIDIGTGSVCIYSLLASLRGWKMLATEIDKISYETASDNVKKNNLSDKITLKFVEEPEKVLVGVIDEDSTYDFCMCNPPFFDNNEKPYNRTRRRKMIETTASYVKTDVVTPGGELEFVKNLISESQKLKDKVRIYTTLVGKKTDFIQIRKEVRNINPVSVADTEFCQGNTTRWGIAWSFLNLNLDEVSVYGAQKLKKMKTKILSYPLPGIDNTIDKASERVQSILDSLSVTFTKENTPDGCNFTVKAFENTWSHQRRKNRMKQKAAKEEDSDGEKAEGSADSKKDAEEVQGDSSDDSSPSKKMKLSNEEGDDKKTILVECMVVLKDENGLILEMSWLSGSKECVHQIFQYIKNNWEKDAKSDAADEKD